VPRPGPDQLVVRVHSCGICGSDIHQLRDGWGFQPGAVAGHEWSGTSPPWATTSRLVGGRARRRRLVGPKCGTCRRCLEGKPSQCENRHSAITDRAGRRRLRRVHPGAGGGVLRLPEGLSARHAALAEPLAVALHGITRSGVAPGDTVMVIGAGPIGALSMAALPRWASTDITVVEPARGPAPAGRRPRGDRGHRPLRARDVFPPGSPRSMSSRAVHVVLECSGHKPPSRRGSTSWPGAASWSWSGPASNIPRSTPTA
jgi:threonine dehydrogenase-like Zn-dependent dehydrogenase